MLMPRPRGSAPLAIAVALCFAGPLPSAGAAQSASQSQYVDVPTRSPGGPAITASPGTSPATAAGIEHLGGQAGGEAPRNALPYTGGEPLTVAAFAALLLLSGVGLRVSARIRP